LRTDILPTDAFSGRQVQKKSWRSSWPPLVRLRLRRSAYKTRQAASVEPYWPSDCSSRDQWCASAQPGANQTWRELLEECQHVSTLQTLQLPSVPS